MALLIFYKNLEPSSARPQSWGAAAAAEKNRKRYSSMKFWRIRPFSKREGKLIKKMKARGLLLYQNRSWPQIFHLYLILPLLRPRKRARQTFYTERRSNLKENLADSIGDNIIMQIMDSAWPVVKRIVKKSSISTISDWQSQLWPFHNYFINKFFPIFGRSKDFSSVKY